MATKRVETNGSGKTDPKVEIKGLTITAPNMAVIPVLIRGTAPLVINRFPRKAKDMMMAAQAAGPQAKKGRKRDPKDFGQCYEEAKHVSADGRWCGIAAPAFRNAMVDACRLCGFKMTHAKLGVFIIADGWDREDGMPLVRITRGEPKRIDSPVRNESGVADIRARPMWEPGWEAVVRVRFDADMFSPADVINLMARAGQQVGVGEGRPNSTNSTGIGWGTFEVVGGEVEVENAS